MTKRFCDRCGKEVKPTKLFKRDGKLFDIALEYTFQKWQYGRKEYEICHDCAVALMKFMNDEDSILCTVEVRKDD